MRKTTIVLTILLCTAAFSTALAKKSPKKQKNKAEMAEIKEWKKRKDAMEPLQLKDLIEENHRLKARNVKLEEEVKVTKEEAEKLHKIKLRLDALRKKQRQHRSGGGSIEFEDEASDGAETEEGLEIGLWGEEREGNAGEYGAQGEGDSGPDGEYGAHGAGDVGPDREYGTHGAGGVGPDGEYGAHGAGGTGPAGRTKARGKGKQRAKAKESEDYWAQGIVGPGGFTRDDWGINERGQFYIKGIVFKVQIGAYKKRDLSNVLEGEKPREAFEQEQSEGVSMYTLRHFRDYWKADQFKKELRAMGLRDAWIVAFKNGHRVPLKEVLQEITQKRR
ncbi:MAG: hypothetical protein ROO73_04090 [Roseivirga sp.]